MGREVYVSIVKHHSVGLRVPKQFNNQILISRLSKLKHLNCYIVVKFYLLLLSLDFQGAKLVYYDTSTVGKHH